MTQREGREVGLLLASGRIVPLTRRELRLAFNSRRLHAFCLGFAILSFLALTLVSDSFDLANQAFTLLVLLPISIFVTFVIYFGSIELALALAKNPKVLIPEPLISMLVALLMVPFQIGLSQVAGFRPLMGPHLTVNNFFFYLGSVDV